MNLEAAKSCWMQTFTGKQFYPLDPRESDVCIEDIAHALSLFNRFGGHSAYAYSVAAHSLHVCDLCVEDPIGGLLHDATEAYMGDMIRPLKFCFPDFKEYEERLYTTIAKALGVSPELHPAVKRCDNIALMKERRDCWARGPVASWGDELEALARKLPPGYLPYAHYEAGTIEKLFLNRFETLKSKKP